MKWMRFLSLAVITTLSAGCSSDKSKDARTASASEPAAGTSVAADAAHQDARDLIRHVAIVNMAEIELGRLAADRSTADAVKQYAQMMIADHTASADKLKVLASDLKIEVPGQLDDKHGGERDKLARQPAADFDREYASAMVNGHKELIDQLEPRIDKKTLEQWKLEMKGRTTVTGGTVAVLPDPSDNPTTMRINQFVADLYPTVHAHAQAAEALENSIKKRDVTP